MGWSLRRRAIAAALLAGLVALALLVGPSQPRAQIDGPPPKALDALQKMEDKILRAKNANDDGDLDRVKTLTSGAIDAKVLFIVVGFRGQQLHGCEAAPMIIGMEALDGRLNKAIRVDDDEDRAGTLKDAVRIAQNLARKTEDCAPSDPRAIVEEIRAKAERLHAQRKKGRLSDDELRRESRQVTILKQELVVGQRVYDCEVLRLFVLIESIDKELEAVKAIDFGERARRAHLRRASKDAGTLIERWREVPCGGVAPPPPNGDFTVQDRLSWFHVNGFGNPPSRECNFISTSPPQPNASVTDVITPPAPRPEVTKTATTDGAGAAVVSMDIDTTGTYTHRTTVTSQSGVQATATESHTVTSAQTGPNGECPPPTP